MNKNIFPLFILGGLALIFTAFKKKPTAEVVIKRSAGGTVGHDGASTYEEAHDGIGNFYNLTTEGHTVGQMKFYYPNSWNVRRGAWLFNTADIPPDIKIVGGSIDIICFGIYNMQGLRLYVVDGSEISDPPASTDFGLLLDSVEPLGELLMTNQPPGERISIPLNTNGLNSIIPGGITKFALRSQEDIEAIDPEGHHYVGYNNTWEEAPQLTIRYQEG